MKTRSLLATAGLLLLMLATLSFLQKKVPGTERMGRESRRLTDLPLREGTRVELTGPKGNFVFEKKGEGDWRIEKPLPTQADSVVVGKLLSDVQFMERLQTVPRNRINDGMIQTFGLGQATRTLSVRTKGGDLKLELGRETPVSGGVYIRIRSGRGEEEVAVVEKHLGEVLDRDLSAWREKRVLPLVVPDVQELLLHQGTLEVEVRRKDGEWTMLKPVEAPADPTAVAGILGEISALKATSFVSDTGGDLALYGLNAPTLAFEVKTTQTNRVLQIGQNDPKETNQVFARVADQASVFLLPRGSVDSLAKLSDRIRDKRVVTFPSPQVVQSVDFSGKGGDFRIERGAEGRRWSLKWGGTNRPADADSIDGWIKALHAARANRFLTTEDPAKLGFTKPRQTLTFTWSVKTAKGSTNRMETFKIGDESKEEAFVQVSSISGGMALPAELIREIPESPLAMLPKNVLPEGLGEVRGLVWASGGKRKEFRSEGGATWKIRGSEKDCPEVSDYVSRLEGLRVAKWILSPGKAEFLKPEAEILVEGTGGQKVKIVLGKATSDGTAPLKIEGTEQVGVLGKDGVGQLKNSPEFPSKRERAPTTQR
ncbi:MAG: DUF4340 domain-containing protein [Verrucomicrobia bacterium]|nr:DUF4340 domain-containing protein [Verrucomicrobiota bacterium]